MFNKKSQIPAIKTIMIIIILGILIVSWLVILYQANSVAIDERKIKTQLVVNKIFHSKCLMDEGFATINENHYNQDSLNSCFEGLDNNLLVSIYINELESEEKILGPQLYALQKKAEFDQKRNFCNLNSNVLCTELKYPITYINAENKNTVAILTLQIISQ